MAIHVFPDVGLESLVKYVGMTMTPAFNGFIKGIGLVILTSVLAFVANVGNTEPLLGIGAATLVAGIASALESHIRANTGKGLFGATKVS